MTDLVRVALLFVAAVNPPRLAGAVPKASLAAASLGAVVALAAAWLIAATSGPLLDALDVTAPTARIAVGLVVGVAGIRDLLASPAPPWEAPRGLRAALVPLAFPLLLRAEVALLAVSAGADEGAAVTVVGAAVALALGGAATVARPAGSVLRAGGRVLGAVLVLLAVDLVVDGVLDV